MKTYLLAFIFILSIFVCATGILWRTRETSELKKQQRRRDELGKMLTSGQASASSDVLDLCVISITGRRTHLPMRVAIKFKSSDGAVKEHEFLANVITSASRMSCVSSVIPLQPVELLSATATVDKSIEVGQFYTQMFADSRLLAGMVLEPTKGR